MAKTPKISVRPLDELILDPANLRLHPDKSKEALAGSVSEFGAARSVVMDRDGIVRAGNGTLEAARAAGITEALVVESDGTQLVVVKRPDWSNEQALAYAIADNRTGELSKFDYQALANTLRHLQECHIPTIGFDATEIDMLTNATWRPDKLVPVDEYQRSSAVPKGLSLEILPEHADEISRALVLEMEAGAATESQGLLQIVRKVYP